MFSLTRSHIFLIIKILLPIFLLVLVSVELRKWLADIDAELLMGYLDSLTTFKLLSILLICLVAFSPMFFYDYFLTRVLDLTIPKRKLINFSVISNSFSNLVGFGGVVGVAIRTYFYRPFENDQRRLLKGIASVFLFYLTGISLMAWIVALKGINSPLLENERWLHIAVWAVALYSPGLLAFHMIKSRQNGARLLTIKTGAGLVAVSLFEWLFVFGAISGISRLIGISITIQQLLPIFIIAACAGIISMIPGGLGSFDLVIVWGFHYLHVPDEKVIMLLLFYRLGYFVFPFVIGLLLLITKYWRIWNQNWNQIPSAISQRVSHFVLTFFVALAGIILLLSAAVPGIVSRIKFAGEFLSFPIMNFSHQLSVAAGFVLLALSRGIQYKVKQVYYLTLTVLIFAAVFSLFKGFDYEEALFLLFVAFLLRLSRKRFYRESYVATWGKMGFDTLIILAVTFSYLLIGYANLPEAKLIIPKSIRPFFILDYMDLFQSAVIGLLIAFICMFLVYVLRKPKRPPLLSSLDHEAEIIAHLNQYGGTELSHVVFLHDKNILWNKNKNVMFICKQFSDKLVILGNPVGEKKEFFIAVEGLLELTDRFGLTPVFYEVSKEMIPILLGNGYDFFKLGEEAYVNLENFTLAGKKQKSLRAIKYKFDSDAFEFDIIAPPFSGELMKELSFVSTEWLRGRKEKGFSLGFFNETYINRTPIVLVKNQQRQIVCFASIMPSYDEKTTISVDLMRFLPEAPPGIMDYLLVNLLGWAKDQRYKRFNVGMAPLSNVGQSKFSFLSEKLASQIFLHGHFFYHFKGLRDFKDKYADHWEPKYLAYRKKSSLSITMLQITLLISKIRKDGSSIAGG